MTSSKAAIVTTLRDAGAVLDSFIAYHRAIGVSHLFLFFDDPADPDLPRIGALPDVTAIPHDAALRARWAALSDFAAQGAFVDREVMARQVLNAGLAMELARERGLDWLLHIDADELFLPAGGNAAEVFARLPPHLETVSFPNLEALPETEDITDFFREVDLFKVPPDLNPRGPTDAGVQFLRSLPQFQPHFFHFYGEGKSAVRLSAPGMRPLGVHHFHRPDASYAAERSPEHVVLHYACCGFENFWTKYRTLGPFGDKWWDSYDIAEMIGPFHLEARDVVGAGDREAARAFYRERNAILNPGIVNTLIRHGFLRRFAQPRALLEKCER